jgi:hypothetical protein
MTFRATVIPNGNNGRLTDREGRDAGLLETFVFRSVSKYNS